MENKLVSQKDSICKLFSALPIALQGTLQKNK